MAWTPQNSAVIPQQPMMQPIIQTNAPISGQMALPNSNDCSWLDNTKQSILIFGPPKHGKTFSYCSYIEDTIKNGGHIYLMSTDSGVPETVKVYFGGGEKAKEVLKGKVTFKEVQNIDEARAFWLTVKMKVRENDLFIIDLMSQFYEWVQMDFIDQISRGNLTAYIMQASLDPKKFGLLEGSKWNYIKAAHRFVEDIIARKKCSVIGVCTEKDVEGERAFGGDKVDTKMKKMGFSDLSVRAGGQKELPYLFDTIIRVAMLGPKQFAAQIIGDRGHNPAGEVIQFGTNLKVAIEQSRKTN